MLAHKLARINYVLNKFNRSKCILILGLYFSSTLLTAFIIHQKNFFFDKTDVPKWIKFILIYSNCVYIF